MSTRRPTMEDVAAAAGVSRALVSIVFRQAPGASEETRARVMAAAAGLGYEPDRRASRLGRSRTRMIGVVFDFAGDFHAEVIDGIYRAATRHGYEVVLSPITPHRSEQAAIGAVLGERCEGVILIGPQVRTREIAELAQRVPTLVLLRRPRLAILDSIATDDAAGMKLLIDHLAGLGHQRITYLDGGTAAGAAQRRKAYRAAMRAHGLEAVTVLGGLSEDTGAVAAEEILQLAPGQRPSAVAAFNDRCAIGALHRLRSGGMAVPADLSLTGFDDVAAAEFRHIDLTTVRQDTETLGALAINRLRERLEEDAAPGLAQLVPPELVIRSTTAQRTIRG